MPKAYISVNARTIRKNAIHGSRDPVIAIRATKSGKAKYVNRVRITGPCELVYDPKKPILKCGARLVLITDLENVK